MQNAASKCVRKEGRESKEYKGFNKTGDCSIASMGQSGIGVNDKGTVLVQAT